MVRGIFAPLVLKTQGVFSVMKIRTLMACMLLSLSSADAKSQSINDLPAEEIRTLTEQAYVFSYPLIMNYATMYKQAIDPNAAE